MRREKKCLLLLWGLVCLGLACFGQEPLKIKVIADYASVRTRPALEAEILDIASKGEIFVAVEKIGVWFKIDWSVDQAGYKTNGYLHENDVAILEPVGEKKQVIEEPAAAPPVPVIEQPPPPKPPQPKPVRAPKQPSEKAISGSFIKFGSDGHWLVSTGLDFGIGRNFGLGLEIQPYYHRDPGLNLSSLTTNLFINAKLGARLAFISLYAGGGVGPELSFITAEEAGESRSEFGTELATHFMAGMELGSKAISLVLEYQMIKVSDPDIDPDRWTHFVFVGLRF